MTAVLSLVGVSRVLTDEVVPVTLVKEASLNIDKGEFISVTGASGSGKSSMLYLMGLLDQPTQGHVAIDGENMTSASEKARQAVRLAKIGFVFQFHFLLQEFSALQNIMLPMRKLGRLKESEMVARAEGLLESLGLAGAGRKMPNQLSGGERQRVAIARALANKPLVILADEPTGNLDSKNSAAVVDIFRKLAAEEGVAIAAVTHDPDFAGKTARRVVMKDGRIVEKE